MITYLVIIAVLNTALGFVLAVYLLPPTALVGIRTRIPVLKIPKTVRLFGRKKSADSAISSSEQVDAVSPKTTTTAVLDDGYPPDTESDLSDAAPARDPSDVEPPADDEPKETPALATKAESVEQIPPDWLDTLEEYGIQAASLVEASTQVLRLEVSNYRDQLVQIDARARETLDSIDAETLRLHLDELREVNELWLAKQTESADHLASRAGMLGGSGGLAARLLDILENQQSQIETTFNNMAEFDIDGDPNGCARRVLVEVRKLLDLAHGLRDRMIEMLLEIKKTDDRLTDIDRSMMFDSLTKLHNRAGLEKVLHEQFLSNNSRTRQLSCALIDIDRFANLMDGHGPIVCDRILVALARLVESLMQQDRGFDMTARFDGQRFFVLLADTGPRGAMSAVERMRQTVAQTTFDSDNLPIELTVRASVAELEADETAESFFDRLEAAANIAKLAGRNCTVLDEGSGPNKIDAPEFEITGRIIPLE